MLEPTRFYRLVYGLIKDEEGHVVRLAATLRSTSISSSKWQEQQSFRNLPGR